jgi:phage gp29-like protein
MPIKDTFARIVRKLIPVDRLTTVNTRSEPSFTGRTISSDVIHSALSQAEAGQPRALFAIYRDMILSSSHIQAELSKRKLAVISSPPEWTSADDLDDDPAVDLLDECIPDKLVFLRAILHLLDGSLWPVAVVEKVFKVENGRYILEDLVPVPAHLLDYTSGDLKIFDVDPTTKMPLGSSHEPDPNRYIIHKGHVLSFPDNWGGPLRSILFWWLLATMDREWWGRMIEKFGTPFLLGKYDAADDQSRTSLQTAFKLATRLGGLVVPRSTEVEIMEASASPSGEAHERFMGICNNQISLLVVGQILSSDAKSTGLGSGVANLQGQVRDDIRQFDTVMVIETIRAQLLDQILAINNVNAPTPGISFGQESGRRDVQMLGGLLEPLFRSGIEVADDGIDALGKRMGLPLQRSTRGLSPITPLSAVPPAARESIARAGAPVLADEFAADLAPLRRIILSASSATEAETQIRAFLESARFQPGRSAEILSQALASYAATGAVV